MNLYKFITTSFLSLFLPSSSNRSKGASIVLDKNEFINAIEKDPEAQIVDVRTPIEHSQGHFAGSKNVNFFDVDFIDQMEKFDKNKPLYLYCKSGNRSGKAAIVLETKGFVSIFDLGEGY